MAFDKRCGDAGFIQFLRVNGGNPAAQADFFFQNRQFGQQDGGLQRVQTAVYADADMVVAASWPWRAIWRMTVARLSSSVKTAPPSP